MFRVRRKELGLSQSELAKGVCTQGTISNIENNSTFPSTYILKEIGKKLNLDIVDIMFVEDETVEKIITKISKLTNLGDHDKAYHELVTRVNVDDIKSESLRKKYYYYLGITSLLGLKDSKYAEEIFNKIIKDFEMFGEIEDILVYLGLGITLYENKNVTEARVMFDKCTLLLNNKKLFTVANIKELLKIYYNVAKFYSGIYEFSTALAICEEGLYWADELDSSYHVGYLYYEKGFILNKMEKFSESNEFYNYAYMYACLKKHDKLKTVILDDKERYGIKLLKLSGEKDENY